MGTTTTMQARIQMAMDALAMSPADLARESKSTTATISNWRNGNVVTDHVKAEQLFRIADALRVDGRWLLLGEYGPGLAVHSPEGKPPVNWELLRAALQLVRDVLDKSNRELAPAKEAEAVQLAYELIEEGLPHAKVLRFITAAVA